MYTKIYSGINRILFTFSKSTMFLFHLEAECRYNIGADGYITVSRENA